MTNHKKCFSDVTMIAKLIVSNPCPRCQMCIYYNGAYCDPKLRKWGKEGTCEEGILTWLNTEEVSGGED